MGVACVVAGLGCGAVTLMGKSQKEGPLVWIAFGLIGLGVFLLHWSQSWCPWGHVIGGRGGSDAGLSRVDR
jgi:hypothetical protein